MCFKSQEDHQSVTKDDWTTCSESESNSQEDLSITKDGGMTCSKFESNSQKDRQQPKIIGWHIPYLQEGDTKWMLTFTFTIINHQQSRNITARWWHFPNPQEGDAHSHLKLTRDHNRVRRPLQGRGLWNKELFWQKVYYHMLTFVPSKILIIYSFKCPWT